MPSLPAATCSIFWNLRGYQNTPIAACATGCLAIGEGYQKIRYGQAKVMLVGGTESLRSELNRWGIDVLGALSKEQEKAENACCPFDKKRSGFILSEGAALLCLEEYESAKKEVPIFSVKLSGLAAIQTHAILPLRLRTFWHAPNPSPTRWKKPV